MDSSLEQDLMEILAPWMGTADENETAAHYRALDVNDDGVLTALIRSEIVPHAHSLDSKMQEAGLRALRAACSAPDQDLEDFWYSSLIAFDLTPVPSHIFELVMEQLQAA